MRSRHGFQFALKAGASALAVLMASAGGAYAQSTTAPSQDEPTTEVDEIVVTGFRASLQSAVSAKRR
ncbi:hypothetical protein NL472_28400, partial [Klebsiella pneumoniae]|nr:hypothetical protein [Klebsiella pneumoniae]